jgi:hypothetical protein
MPLGIPDDELPMQQREAEESKGKTRPEYNLSARRNWPESPPDKTGLILVALWGAQEYEIVNVTEFGMNYVRDETPADLDEWQWWADLSALTFSEI